MTGQYLLDTNAASAVIRGRQNVSRRALAAPEGSLSISSVTAAELFYGLEKHPNATTLAYLVNQFLDHLIVHVWTIQTARQFGILRARLEKQGRSISPLDLMIAAHAIDLGATLISADKAFKHIEGLRVEDWSV